MNILVLAETNFVVGYLLEQGTDFRYLVELTGNYPLRIAVSEYALKEGKTTSQERLGDFRNQLGRTRSLLREVERSQFASDTVRIVREGLTDLTNQLEHREGLIQPTLDSLASACTAIPHSPQAHIHGLLRHVGSELPLKESDCEIYESILEFAQNEIDAYDHLIFLTLDREHFDHDEIRDELADMGIDLALTTGECIAMVRYALGLTA